jgi:hypothetical protein
MKKRLGTRHHYQRARWIEPAQTCLYSHISGNPAGGDAHANFFVTYASLTALDANVCTGNDGGCAGFTSSPNHLTINETILLPINEDVHVFENQGSFAFGKGVKAVSGVQPYFSLDPSETDQYALVFSDGIDNSPISPTPLPSALPLFGCGVLALAGFAAWRRGGRCFDGPYGTNRESAILHPPPRDCAKQTEPMVRPARAISAY